MIGIDLGTTNSLVSFWGDRGVELISNCFGEYLTPSVVSFDADGTIYVGKTAKERLVTHPDVTFQEFKRDMGSDVVYRAYGKVYKPEDLSALVLKQLKQDAEQALGRPIDEAVISVPAYFNDKQRAATRNAGILAGLKVERLINEPSAAALSHHINHIYDSELFLVFDFGGGTLDVSLVDAFDNVIEIQGVSGDNALGGKDFNAIIAYDICERNGLDWRRLDDKEKAILIREAENVKIGLTGMDALSTTIRLGTKEYPYQISNQDLINISADLFLRITKVLTKLMNDAEINVEDVSRVIMVGGSSKMPVVRHYIASLFDGRLCEEENPDEIVCRGAGVVCGIKERNTDIKDIMLSDICPFTLGVGITGDILSPIIEKNQPLPCSHVERYYTSFDMQKCITWKVYQGENRVASENLKLTEITLNVPAKPKGEVHADVRFSYDINGLFDIDIFCEATNEHYHQELGSTSGMSQAEITRRQAELDKIKIHPRDMEQNKYILERAHRLFAQCNQTQQEMLAMSIMKFQNVLEEQNISKANKAYEEFNKELEVVEGTLFRFDQFSGDVWK